MNCKFCGKEIKESIRFCPHCGKEQEVVSTFWKTASLDNDQTEDNKKIFEDNEPTLGAWNRKPKDRTYFTGKTEVKSYWKTAVMDGSDSKQTEPDNDSYKDQAGAGEYFKPLRMKHASAPENSHFAGDKADSRVKERISYNSSDGYEEPCKEKGPRKEPYREPASPLHGAETKKKNSGGWGKILIASLAAVLVLVPVVIILSGKNKSSASSGSSAEASISYEEDTGLPYYNDRVIVYTESALSEDRAEELAELIGGTVGSTESLQLGTVQINVSESDKDTLEMDAFTLMNEEDVILSTYDYPVEFQDTSDNNPWRAEGDGVESDLGNTENPSGNDWWAEAVDAYYVWENYSNDLTPVPVGMIDAGFAVDHEELAGKITIIGDNSDNDHGTTVAGLITAKNNEVGIRGIADQSELIACDRTTGEGYLANTGNAPGMSQWSGYVMSLLNNGARVINISAGFHVYKGDSDESCRANSERTAKNALDLMYILYQRKAAPYLIVQAAGNGLNNSGPGLDAFYCGFICSITKEVYEDWAAERQEIPDTDIPDYEYFKEHTMIAGAVDPDYSDGDSGRVYTMSFCSNYGANIDICAPGSSIFTTSGEDGNSYTVSTGTSLAAPIITGAAAVVWSINPDLSAGEVKDLLIQNSRDRVFDDDGDYENEEYGTNTYPMLNVGAAAKAAYESKENSDDDSEKKTEKKAKTTPEPTPEATPEPTPAAVSDQDAFNQYLEEVLIPQYGVIPTDTLELADTGNGGTLRWSASDVNGLLSATIQDYDNDGYDEMLVVLFYSSDDGDTDLGLQMYEYIAYSDEVQLCADTRLDTSNGYCGNDTIGYRQIGIFSYMYNGYRKIAIDTSLIANESISTMAVYSYIGINSEYTQPGAENPEYGTGTPTQFSYYSGAGWQQQGYGTQYVWKGSSTYEERSTVDPENPLFCASRGSEWSAVCSFDPDQPDGSYREMTSEEYQNFRNTYYSLLEEAGLYANDTRLGTDSSRLTTEEYNSNHIITPDIYSAAEGEISWISGIYTYDASESYTGPLHLVRQDNTHSLDSYR